METKNLELLLDFIGQNMGYITIILLIILIMGFIVYFISKFFFNKQIQEAFLGYKTEYQEQLNNLFLKKKFKKAPILILNDQNNIIKKALNSTNYTNRKSLKVIDKNENLSQYEMVIIYIEPENKNNNPNEIFKQYKEEALESLESENTILFIYHEGMIDRNLLNKGLPKNNTFINSLFTLTERLENAYLVKKIMDI